MTDQTLPPLQFLPLIKPLPWGGRKLETLFAKTLPADLPCGESWEVVDLPGEQSVVAAGPWQGRRLAELIELRRQELLGEAELLLGRFPLLFKLIDAAQTLSVQVHPDAEAARRLGGEARPKTEAWYILQVEPGAHLYVGLEEGVSLDDLRRGLADGRVEPLLRRVPVQAGDFIYLPAGTLHAIGAGIVLAEIQQASDTTYRVFDWNRVGLDGRPRQLHVEQALASIRPELAGRPGHAAPASGRPGIRCRFFTFERVRLDAGGQVPLDAGRPRITCCLEGSAQVSCGRDQPLRLSRGDSCLVPACRSESLQSPDGATLLLVRVGDSG